MDSLTPQSPAAVALSDTRRCEARDRRDISPEESFSEAALVKKPAPGFGEIIQAIQNPIKIYQIESHRFTDDMLAYGQSDVAIL